MNTLETAASPLLVPLMRGEATALSAHALHALSAWTFKTVLMIHEQADSHEQVIHDDSYAYLYEHREPPPGVQIWLAEHGASLEDRVAIAFSTIDRLVITQSGDKEIPEGTAFYGAALALGRLIMLVIGRHDATAMPEFADMAAWMRRAWPNDRAVIWPPVRSVDEHGGFWSFYERLFPSRES
ncbi:MAG: hypothetical protein QOI82_2950 [Actinomycetota bacterium]|jgi:hypothetical protein|nr:hypothetical protein [Actinomycetota bacterium]